MKMDPNSLAIELICPICHVLPTDPVIAEDGFIYCNVCIKELIDRDDSRQIPSPMTRAIIGKTLIHSDIVEETIRKLTECEELDDDLRGKWPNLRFTTGNELLETTTTMAKGGDLEAMTLLARWNIFGEIDAANPKEGYLWCRRAAGQDSMVGKAYQGYCLIRGFGVEVDWEEGYELLVEAASEEDPGGRDIAAYTLWHCYEHGMNGFKLDTKKAKKWLAKVQSEPDYMFFDYRSHLSNRYGDCNDSQSYGQLSGSTLLFPNGLPGDTEYDVTKVDGENNKDDQTAVTETSSYSIHSASARSTLANSQCAENHYSEERKHACCSKCAKTYSYKLLTGITSTLCPDCKTIGSSK